MISESTITKYTCSDGTSFTDKHRAEKWQEELESLADLPSIPAFELRNGQRVKFDKETMFAYRRLLWERVLAKYGESYPKWKTWNADEVQPLSIVGRVMDDHGCPIAKAWQRMSCWNFEHGTIHDQPYFALNFDESKEMETV